MPKQKPEAEEPKVDLLGQLSVELDGTEYMLRPSKQAICNIEKLTDKPLMMLAARSTTLMLPVEDLGVCVAELMRAYAAFDPSAGADYRGANPERCADLVYGSNSLKIQGLLGVIFKGALTGGFTPEGEAKAAGTKTTEPTLTAE